MKKKKAVVKTAMNQSIGVQDAARLLEKSAQRVKRGDKFIVAIVTGASGSGKDYFADTYLKSSHFYVIKGDSFGSKTKDEKWIVPGSDILKEVDKAISDGLLPVIVGMSDNEQEWGEVLAPFALDVYFLRPTNPLYRNIMRAKAESLIGKKNFSEQWYQGYLSKASGDNSSIDQYWASKIKDKHRFYDFENFHLVMNSASPEVKITEGWHKSTKK
jgi:hypothetical protein